MNHTTRSKRTMAIKRLSVGCALALSLGLGITSPWHQMGTAHAMKAHCDDITDRGTWWLLTGEDPGEGFMGGTICWR